MNRNVRTDNLPALERGHNPSRRSPYLLLTLLALPIHTWGLVTPTGGEAFAMNGGTIVTAADVASKILQCPPPAPLPLTFGQVPPPNVSPLPTVGWRASRCDTAGNPADAQVAVSTTRVVVTFEASMAWYDKSGAKQGELTNFGLFEPLLAPLAQSVGRARDANDCYYAAADHNKTCARTQSDFRIIFDEYRKRFWAVDGAGIYTADWVPDPNNPGSFIRDPKKARGIIMLAVSQSEDPKDGWYLYWWDAVAHWCSGFCPANEKIYQPGDGADYPSIGVNPFGFYQTISVGDINGNAKYVHVVFFQANDNKLISGTAVPGWHYFDLQNPDGSAALNVIQPVVHHGLGGGTYFVSRYGADEVLVWVLDPLQPKNIQRAEVKLVDPVTGKSVPFNAPQDAPQRNGPYRISMTNAGTEILKAVYRSGELMFAATDAAPWFNDGILLTSVRLVRLYMFNYPNIPTLGDASYVNRRIGKNSWDDMPQDRMYYGWPAIEVNKHYDMAVVYARSGATIDPEVRYSAYYFAESDIRQPRALKLGDAAYTPGSCASNVCRWGDTAGAAVDPDDTGIWVAQQYANSSNGWDIWVARIF